MSNQVIEQYKNQGYDVQGSKILAATPRRVERYSALGLSFVCQRDGKDRIVKRGWTAVTKSQALKLKTLIDPVTDEAYLRFAYVPIPTNILEGEKKKVDQIDLADLNGKDGIDEADLGSVARPLESVSVDEGQVEQTQDGQDAAFAKVSADQDRKLSSPAKVEKETEEKDEASVTAEQVERAELKLKSIAELKKIVKDDIGLEVPKNASKEELIEIIVS